MKRGFCLSRISRLIAMILVICTMMSGVSVNAAGAVPTPLTGAEEADDVTVSYSTHFQDKGWLNDVSNGEAVQVSGKRLEAVKIKLKTNKNLGIRYKAHVQNIGWQSWASDGSVAGTFGRSYRVEAVCMELTGSDKDDYDLYYTVMIGSLGWTKWAKNGSIAGSTGLSAKITGIAVMVVKKSDEAPDSGSSISTERLTGNYLAYSVHAEGIGWMSETSGVAGTTGQSRRLEAIKIRLKDAPVSGGITYRTHVQNIGWTGWSSDGDMSGTTGRAYRMEAIEIKLTGDMADYFDVYYRTHVQNFGWSGWAKNGESCGSSGYSYRVEAIEIVLRVKGTDAPGSTSDTYHKATAVSGASLAADEAAMLAKAQGYSSSTRYLILVNKSVHKVLVCEGSQGNWSAKYVWLCGDGAANSQTIEGTFTVQDRVINFGNSHYLCWYAVRFCGAYYFHSVKYVPASTPATVLDGRVGQGVSAGCVRLEINNAKWIYDNVPRGTTVVVYH